MANKQKFKKPPKPLPSWIGMVTIGLLFCLVMPWMIIAVVLFLIIYGISRVQILKSTKRDFGFLGNEEDIIKFILALAAYLAKSANTVQQAEKKFIEDSIKHDFKEKYSDRYVALFNKYLEIDINLKKVCLTLRAQYNISSTIHLMHFLVGLVAADGVLSREEEHKLFAIARNLRLPYASLRSIIAMFNLQREANESKSNNNYKRPVNSAASLSNAYAIFDLSSAATNDKIKKAYRKLAKLHHPDKVAHLGKFHQEKAKIKFQKILDAYELIKKSRDLP
jgi:DnaJ like chaperone protein